jgi:hypothetical protein
MACEHSWYFTFGLAVAVREQSDGRSGWEWTQDRAPAQAAAVLDGEGRRCWAGCGGAHSGPGEGPRGRGARPRGPSALSPLLD